MISKYITYIVRARFLTVRGELQIKKKKKDATADWVQSINLVSFKIYTEHTQIHTEWRYVYARVNIQTCISHIRPLRRATRSDIPPAISTPNT